ncbi:hypothetical protein AAVH_11266 [Aphelenchoides avenae]|nr:hypothetical protein AAVH_11266 [Aphelenchus avenae]
MQLRSHNLEAFDDLEQANDDGRKSAAVPKHTAPKGKRNRAAVSTPKPIVVEPDESDADDGQWDEIDRYFIRMEDARPLTSGKRNRAGASTPKPIVVEPDESDADDAQWDEIDRYCIHMEDARPLTSVTALKSAVNVDISESTLTTGYMAPGAIKRVDTRDTPRCLSFNSDVPSCDWEMLSADLQDSNLRHEAADRVIEPMEHGGKDECNGRFSVSSFGSGSTRSSFYRDER